MCKQVLVLFFAITWLTLAHNEGVAVSTSLDDAKAALEELRQIARGQISGGIDELANSYIEFETSSDNILKLSLAAIQEQAEVIYGQLVVLKDLANSAAVDISYCLSGREDYLKQLPQAIATELGDCVFDKVKDGARTVNDSKYFIDITINRVHDLENQINVCGNSTGVDACLQPVIDEIELETVQIPKTIKLEVSRAKGILETLLVSVQECSDLKESEYSSASRTIMKDLADCINAVIGKR